MTIIHREMSGEEFLILGTVEEPKELYARAFGQKKTKFRGRGNRQGREVSRYMRKIVEDKQRRGMKELWSNILLRGDDRVC